MKTVMNFGVSYGRGISGSQKSSYQLVKIFACLRINFCDVE